MLYGTMQTVEYQEGQKHGNAEIPNSLNLCTLIYGYFNWLMVKYFPNVIETFQCPPLSYKLPSSTGWPQQAFSKLDKPDSLNLSS